MWNAHIPDHVCTYVYFVSFVVLIIYIYTYQHPFLNYIIYLTYNIIFIYIYYDIYYILCLYSSKMDTGAKTSPSMSMVSRHDQALQDRHKIDQMIMKQLKPCTNYVYGILW